MTRLDTLRLQMQDAAAHSNLLTWALLSGEVERLEKRSPVPLDPRAPVPSQGEE